MANKKITDLSELTAVASDDVLEIVDTSAGTSMKISQGNLVGGQPKAWTPAPVGWVSILGVFRYITFGNICIAFINVTAGTSNDTVATLTLPVTSANIPNHVWGGVCGRAVDASAVLTTPCRWEVTANSNIVTFYKDMASAAWTNSGTKLVRATVIYEI